MKSLQIPRRFTRKAWGGTETVVLETSKRLIASGHETRIVCPEALDPTKEDEIEGVPVTRLPYFYPYTGLSTDARAQLDRKGGNLFSFSLMARLLTEPRVDLFHAHTGKRLGGIVRFAARMRRIPYVISLHGGVYDVPSGEAASWTSPTAGTFEWGKALGALVGSRRVLSDASAVICLGEQERRSVERAHPGTRAVILPNGVDPLRFRDGDGERLRSRLGIAASDELMLVAGRIDPQKNQRLAIDLLAELGPTRSRLHLALMGPVTSPAYLAELKDSARAKGLESRVRFFEAAQGSTDLADAYAAADLVLVPSAHEPFGIVALEAWSSRRPLLASRVGGLIDLVDDGRDGRLIAPDDRGAWVRAADSLLLDRSAARGMANEGHSKATRFYTWDSVTRRLEALYSEVVDASRAKSPRAVAAVGRP